MTASLEDARFMPSCRSWFAYRGRQFNAATDTASLCAARLSCCSVVSAAIQHWYWNDNIDIVEQPLPGNVSWREQTVSKQTNAPRIADGADDKTGVLCAQTEKAWRADSRTDRQTDGHGCQRLFQKKLRNTFCSFNREAIIYSRLSWQQYRQNRLRIKNCMHECLCYATNRAQRTVAIEPLAHASAPAVRQRIINHSSKLYFPWKATVPLQDLPAPVGHARWYLAFEELACGGACWAPLDGVTEKHI